MDTATPETLYLLELPEVSREAAEELIEAERKAMEAFEAARSALEAARLAAWRFAQKDWSRAEIDAAKRDAAGRPAPLRMNWCSCWHERNQRIHHVHCREHGDWRAA